MLILSLCILLTFSQISNGFANFTNHLQEYARNDGMGISPECKADLKQYVESLFSTKPEDLWAKQMFDAGVKIPSGIFEGPGADLGEFDECISTEVTTESYKIYGHYCLGSIPFPSEIPEKARNILLRNPETRMVLPDGGMGIQLATCLPSGCSRADVEKIYSIFDMTFHKDLCQTKASQPELDGSAVAAISFFGVILWIMISSTAYDAVLFYLNKKPHHPMLVAFSVLTNTKKILETSSNPNQISCLHGIRVISTMWVIMGHRYVIQNEHPMKNYAAVAKWLENPANMFMMQGTISVDTFLVIGGMVISYSYMSAVTKGVKFNILAYYIHRYLRLTPVLGVIIIIRLTLLKHFGSGPLWPYMIYSKTATACENNWWRALLHFQNYAVTEICVAESWYLSVDTQLFLFSPILLIPLSRWPLLTMAATGLLTACSILTSFLLGWFYELNHNTLGNTDPETSKNYLNLYYLPTHTRASTWLIGIILGYIVFKLKHKKKEIVINRILMLGVWGASFAILGTCVFASHNLIFGEYDRLANSFHLALVRPAWSVAVGAIIFACIFGHGGPVNWFLSLPVFQVISKLTFSMYLAHCTTIYFLTSSIRDSFRFSNERLMYIYWGDLALVITISFVLTLAFESPIIIITKCLFGGGGSKKKEVPPPTVPTKEEYGTKPLEKEDLPPTAPTKEGYGTNPSKTT